MPSPTERSPRKRDGSPNVTRKECIDAAGRSDHVAVRSWPLDSGPFATADIFGPSAGAGGLVCGLLLASLEDHGYLIPPRRGLSAGLAAAALVELAFRRRVGADGSRLLVADAAPTGDAVVDPVLELLAARRRAPDVGPCLADLSLDWTILGRAGQVLEARGLARIERRPLHPLIMHRFHPVPPDRPAELRAGLRSILEGAATPQTAHDAALASLAAATGLGASGLGKAGPCKPGATGAGEVLSVVHPALVSATRTRREAHGGCAGAPRSGRRSPSAAPLPAPR